MSAELSQIARWIQAVSLASPGGLNRSVETVHGCDLMSDVLAFSRPGTLLLTGLTNEQVVRTAEVAGILGVIFVRGKKPGGQVVAMAGEFGLPILSSPLSMFDACGILYSRGLRGWSG